MKTNNKKPSSRNLRINTRIVLTSLLAIIIPIIIIISTSTVIVNTFTSFFRVSAVNTNTYSALNSLQWTQTVQSISNHLTEENDDASKTEELEAIAEPLKELGTEIYIEKNGELFYATGENILSEAQKIAAFEKNGNLNYFGGNGLLLVNHADDGNDNYLIVITNPDYTVNNASQRPSPGELKDFLIGRAGIFMLFIVLLFIISIVTISFITSQTIVKPIKKISVGAEEIAKGNLDYNIDYESTNELGQMADSFNNMRVRLSASLENQRKAEEERRELVAGIAHDLRTPLTSVKGYAEGLRDGIASTPEKQRLYINTICSSIDDTEKTLDDLLAYSKLELKSFSLNPERVYINEFFKDGAEEIKTALEAVDFDFNYISTCSDDTVLMLDSDRFTRVIRNIISNSIKYKREGVKGKVELHINEYERSVIIEITDNGIGVDKESLPKIFDTMYRADRARSGVSEGSGLGLSICRQIVELHGGTIWATGNYGQGLSIFISMPKEISK